jgi:hypothetical protein
MTRAAIYINSAILEARMLAMGSRWGQFGSIEARIKAREEGLAGRLAAIETAMSRTEPECFAGSGLLRRSVESLRVCVADIRAEFHQLREYVRQRQAAGQDLVAHMDVLSGFEKRVAALGERAA